MRTWLRRIGIGLAALVGIVVLAAAGVYVAGGRKLQHSFAVTPRPPAEPSAADSALVARGRHLATAIGKCAACHGDDFGGQVMIDDPALGRAVAANLTPGRGGRPADWGMADWDRAIRHGVRRDGTGLIVMPADDFAAMSDGDLVALVAFLRQLPSVDRELPPTQLRLVGRALFVADKLPLIPAARIDHSAPPAEPVPGPTAEYGRYLVRIGGCTGCHGPTLAGGPTGEPGAPPAANLTPTGIGHYTEADFFRALREGKRPDGSPIADFMPVRFTKLMSDDETRAIFAYLKTVEPRPTGARE
ncbi:MAG TPA: cytochrome c [Gemmatimonadaceae bacterium]|nr:cytochrome c [Gemmatimonadaceae bacterium]